MSATNSAGVIHPDEIATIVPGRQIETFVAVRIPRTLGDHFQSLALSALSTGAAQAGGLDVAFWRERAGGSDIGVFVLLQDGQLIYLAPNGRVSSTTRPWDFISPVYRKNKAGIDAISVRSFELKGTPVGMPTKVEIIGDAENLDRAVNLFAELAYLQVTHGSKNSPGWVTTAYVALALAIFMPYVGVFVALYAIHRAKADPHDDRAKIPRLAFIVSIVMLSLALLTLVISLMRN